MYLLWITLLMSGIGFGITTHHFSQMTSANTQAMAERLSTDILSYRRAVIDFKTANNGYSGTVTSTQMAPYLLWGDVVKTPSLNNVITDGTLYVWYTGLLNNGSAYATYDKLGGSLFVGFNKSGTLSALKNSQTINTGITLPGSIPANAFVIYGE